MLFKPPVSLLLLHKIVPDSETSGFQEKQKLEGTNEETMFSKAGDYVGHNSLNYALKSSKITENVKEFVHCSLV